MTTLKNKIDFIGFVSVTMANPGGDPQTENMPRVTTLSDMTEHGVMSDVCIKRKMRNRLQDMGEYIFVQSADRTDDGNIALKDRAEKNGITKAKSKEENMAEACRIWTDVRAFGQVFAYDNISIGITGPVSIHQAVSVDPVEIESMQITKSVSSSETEKKGSDTMGMKHFVKFGLYKVKGSINVQQAGKTGFTEKDAELIKESLRTLFVNDASSARPDGSMEMVRLYWIKHNCDTGQYSAGKTHNFVNAKLKDGIAEPSSAEDYEFINNIPADLEYEEIEGF